MQEREIIRERAQQLEDAISKHSDRYNVLDYAEEHGILKDVLDTGDRVTSKCPFHIDRSPSFFISKRNNVFHCFSCGKHGGYARLLTSIENELYNNSVTYYEVLEKILRNDDALKAELGFNTIYHSVYVLPSQYVKPAKFINKARIPVTYCELATLLQENEMATEKNITYSLLAMQKGVSPEKIYHTLMGLEGKPIVQNRPGTRKMNILDIMNEEDDEL